MTTTKKLIYIITGPTAVGKTDFALDFAKKNNGEIINIDVGQFYAPLNIGTAKPDWKNYPIAHHLFDILNRPIDFTTFDYQKIVAKTINEIINRGKLPILVGGSGFYIQSLFFPSQDSVKSKINKNETESNEKQNKLNPVLRSFSEVGWEKLYEIDPVRASKIEKNDIYRINRALEIWKSTGIRPSEYVQAYQPEFDFILYVLTRDREELYERINKRVMQMFESGWLQEVENLNQDWNNFLNQKKLIGYDDIIKYLQSENVDISQDYLIEVIQKKTRNYAKRQLTFFRMLSKKIIKAELESNLSYGAKKIIWADLTNCDKNFILKLYKTE